MSTARPFKLTSRFVLSDAVMICDEDVNIYLIPSYEPAVRLNINATDIFKLCIEGNTVRQIISKYGKLYKSTDEEVKDDIIDFIAEMLNKKYLLNKNESSPH